VLFLIDSKSRPVRGIFCQCPNSQHPIADFESKAVAGFVVDGPLVEDRVRLPNGKFLLVTTLCVVTIFGRSASFPFLMLFLLSDNFGRRAAEERSHAEHGNEDKSSVW